MQTFSYDVIIIGAGCAGLTAGIYAKRAGLKTLVIEETVAGGQLNLISSIENYPGMMSVSGHDLVLRMTEQCNALGVEFVYDEIENVDLQNKTIKLYDANYKASAIIIACGAGPRKLNVPNEDKFTDKGVHYCALCDGNFYKGKNVVMVGGGNSAVEDSIYLSALAKSVTIVNVTPEFTAQKILVDSLLEQKNIKNIYQQSVVSEILGKDRVEGVKIKNIKTDEITEIKCDGVFVAIGRTPNVKLFGGDISLSKDGYIKTDEKCATNMKGIYAAGDIREKHYRQIVTATADGAIAASAAADFIRGGRG